MPRRPARLPDFLYVGMSKAGSSWLYEILREHPEVFVPPAKDVMFDRHFDRGVGWYASFFARAGGAKAAGELTHDYMLSPLSVERMQMVVPHAKLLVCLREPGAWAFSRYLWERSTGLPRDVGFEAFLERPRTVRELDVLRNLKTLYAGFPSQQIKVLFFDDLGLDAAGFARDVFEFLGVDPSFVPPSLHRRVYSARRARIGPIGAFSYEFAQVLRGLGLANVVGAVKRHPVFDRVVFGGIPEQPPPPAEPLRRLRERQARDYPELERLVGRPLPQAWRAAVAQAPGDRQAS